MYIAIRDNEPILFDDDTLLPEFPGAVIVTEWPGEGEEFSAEGGVVVIRPFELNKDQRKRYEANPPAWADDYCDRFDAHLHGKVLPGGFLYGGATIQADPVAQQNANGFLTAIISGLPVFPIRWRTLENTDIVFETEEEYKTFATTFLGFVQSQYHRTWKAKDDLRAATSFEAAWAVIQEYLG